MAIAFSRSLRALERRSARRSIATLATVAALAAAWCAWLALAPVDVHESSDAWVVARDGSLVVKFPLDTLPRLRVGQPAELVAQAEPGRPAARWPATVVETPGRPRGRLDPDAIRVALDLRGKAAPRVDVGGTVRVRVERLTPLEVLRRAGLGAHDTASPPGALTPATS